MKSTPDRNSYSEVERQARAAFDDSVSGLDAATLSRLNQSRQRALAAAGAGRSPQRLRGLAWIPAGAVAAAALTAVFLLRMPSTPEPTGAAAVAVDQAPDPLVLLAAGDDLELAAAEDLDFYAWVDLETTGGAG